MRIVSKLESNVDKCAHYIHYNITKVNKCVDYIHYITKVDEVYTYNRDDNLPLV